MDVKCLVLTLSRKNCFCWRNMGRYEIVPVLGRGIENSSVHAILRKNLSGQPRLPLPERLNEKQRREQIRDPAQPNPAQPAPWVGCQCLLWALRIGDCLLTLSSQHSPTNIPHKKKLSIQMSWTPPTLCLKNTRYRKWTENVHSQQINTSKSHDWEFPLWLSGLRTG